MLRWHMTFERKLVEQSVLPALTFPHHRQHSNPPDRIESPPPCPDNSRFFQHNPPKPALRAASTEVLPRPAAVACHKGRGRFKLAVVRALGNMLPPSASRALTLYPPM